MYLLFVDIHFQTLQSNNLKLQFIATYWGSESLPPTTFLQRILNSGYSGIEVFLPTSGSFCTELLSLVAEEKKRDPSFQLILQHISHPQKEDMKAFMKRDADALKKLLAFQPDFINAHTGTDFFSFEDNCRIIETYQDLQQQTGIRILHETHRGRFSFHAATLLRYLDFFPELELTGDFSHFCTVSESMLSDQEEILRRIIPHVAHIHARVGFEQAPQVSNPFAPEWQSHLSQFVNWWQQIINQNQLRNKPCFTITPEFGPVPYMPVEPFTQKEMADQWQLNVQMKEYLQAHLNPQGA